MDHFALSVTNLDAWVARLKAEGVKFLEQPYAFGETHAALIEGPSREAIELVSLCASHRDALRLGHPHECGQPIIGARRHPDRRDALGAQRLGHRVDAVDTHGAGSDLDFRDRDMDAKIEI